MNCAVCNRALERREKAQPFQIGRVRFLVPSLCDACAKENQYMPGSRASLDRLLTGALDEAEVARLAEDEG